MNEIVVTSEDGFYVFTKNGVDIWDFRCNDAERAMDLLKDKRWFTSAVQWSLNQAMRVAA